jgi:hypothetical protein
MCCTYSYIKENRKYVLYIFLWNKARMIVVYRVEAACVGIIRLYFFFFFWGGVKRRCEIFWVLIHVFFAIASLGSHSEIFSWDKWHFELAAFYNQIGRLNRNQNWTYHDFLFNVIQNSETLYFSSKSTTSLKGPSSTSDFFIKQRAPDTRV